VRLLRTLSTPRLLLLVAVVVAVATGAAAIAVAARGGSGETPPPKPLAEALHDAATAPEAAGVTARIEFSNRLFPSGSLIGSVGSALMSGASGRLWATNDGRGRLELQSDAGDVQVVWTPTQVTIYDASSNTVYRAALPAKAQKDAGTPPSMSEIESFLEQLGAHASVSGAEPTNVAGEPAYEVRVSPKHDGGLLGSAALAWDALHGVPLRLGVYAQGSSSPVLELTATDITFGPVADSDVDVSPPAGAKVVDLGAPAQAHNGTGDKEPSAVTGLDAVRAAAPFPVVAPDTLVGLPLRDIRLVGGERSPSVLALYGRGLGAVVVVERKPDGSAGGSMLSALPTVSLDGVTAHELATQLGTVVTWDRGGTSFVLAGSLPPAAAESAARSLR
jgi:outer membrane lipoprotein-sorting protein